VAGAIALILALYMGAILPINLAGVALIVLAVALFIIDLYAPTHGVLTAGGIVAFFLGALFLFDRGNPQFRLSYFAVIPATVVTAAFFVFLLGAGVRAQRLPKKVGREALSGRVVTALDRIDAASGHVLIDGEYWSARSGQPIEPGTVVEIVGLRGLIVDVRPKNSLS
jgi:membrane-bound serine protease (ClpP class)